VLNDTAEYALRAALYIAQHGTEAKPARAEAVASALNIPRNYLAKILHIYARNGILASTRGPAGGFWLAMPAGKLPLAKLVEPFSEVSTKRECVLGRSECSDRNPCPAHSRWRDVSEGVAHFFRKTTVEDLLNQGGSLSWKV
jgi:Rrf2 family protein